MRALLKKYWVALFTATVLLSCTEEAIVSEVPKTDSEHVDLSENDYKVSIEEAEEYLTGFLKHLDDPLTYGSNGGRKIKNVEAIRSNRQIQTYASENDLHVDLDTLMYAINFENGQGFALMAADRRTTPIYAIIDEGEYNYDEAIKNPGFAMFMQNAIVKELEDIKNYENMNKTSLTTYSNVGNTGRIDDWKISQKYGPYISVQWGQGSPYDKYCPGVTGCGITATAQILSYLKPNLTISYNNSYPIKLNWPLLTKKRQLLVNEEGDEAIAVEQVAILMRYLGLTLDAHYWSGGTWIKPNKGVDFLKRLGYQTTSLSKYNFNTIKKTIEDKGVVYIVGFSDKVRILFWKITDITKGHIWVIDGYVTGKPCYYNRSDPPRYYYGSTTTLIHCNWGWKGKYNGYFEDDVFLIGGVAPRESYEPDPDRRKSSDGFKQYKYNVEIATVKPK